ncbi:MAG TPA: hypothetical protein VL426_07575 [Candidatus Binatia bacterium]|jgi:hypothetical protein|nr:hypothetical protein [Candidatus Binatia bacterium]
MSETPVVPFLARSTLFIAGMTARCPALGVLVAHASRDANVAPLRRQLLLEMLMRRLPALPAAEDDAAIVALAAMTAEAVDVMASRHRGRGADALRAIWEDVAIDLTVEAERDLLRRCGVLLTELYRLSAHVSRVRLATPRKNA